LRTDVLPQGSGNPTRVDAVVLVEAAILDRDDRLAHDRRHIADVLQQDAALVSAKDREYGAAVGCIDNTVKLRPLRRGVEKGDLARDRTNQTE